MMSTIIRMARALLPLFGKTDVEAMSWLLVAFLLAVLAIIVLLRVVKTYKERTALYPPMYSEGLPLIGNLLAFRHGPTQFVRRGHDRYGDCFTVRMGPKRMTFMLSPAAHEVVLLGKDDEVDMTPVYRFAVPIFGPKVVYDAPFEERYFQYKMLANGLRATKLRSYVDAMVYEAENFFRRWGDEGEVDLFQELGQLIIMTASRCLLGKEVREEMFNEVADLIYTLDQGMQVISLFAPHLPIEVHRKRDQARRDLQGLFKQILDKRRSSGYRGDDLLQVFMDGTRKDGTSCEDTVIVGLLIAAIFGGQHTSSITSTWLGAHLLRDNEVMTRVMNEQDRIANMKGEKKLDFEALSQMNELHYCMKESLRMYPPLIFLMRRAEVDRHYKKKIIPKGDILFVSPAVSGRLPALWERPDSWEPDRFAPPRSEDKKVRLTFLGFGGGRHSCMGEQFAYLQIKTIWSYLLNTFELKAVGPLNQPDYEALVVGPKGPVTVHYKRKVHS